MFVANVDLAKAQVPKSPPPCPGIRSGELTDVQLDGESVYPTWFKIEWKESGEVSAKVKGVRLATRYGDAITIHAQPR